MEIFRRLSIRLQLVLNAVLVFHQSQPYKCYRAYLYFFLHWVVGAFELFLILYFSGITIPIVLSQFMDMGIVIIKSFGAFIPAQIGIEEFGNRLLLTSAGIYTIQVWLIIALIRRSRQVFWIIFGFFAYLGLKKVVDILIWKFSSSVTSFHQLSEVWKNRALSSLMG